MQVDTLPQTYYSTKQQNVIISHVFQARDMINIVNVPAKKAKDADNDETMEDASEQKTNLVAVCITHKSIISTDYQSQPSISPQSHAPLSDFLSSQSNSALRLNDNQNNFMVIMQERWHKSNNLMPQIDLKDIVEENPNFNQGKKTCPEHQHHPEYTQTSYLRVRYLEEAFQMENYLDLIPKKLSLGQRIQNTVISITKKSSDKYMTAHDRSYGIQKIFDLHQKKDYKCETLFIATGIFDRYIYAVGVQNFLKQNVVNLATISILMAAKLEQPISPSFTRMINLLTEEEKKFVSKQQLIDIEAHILMMLGFDFNFPGPIQSMERYLRILDYDLNKTIYDMSFQISKFQCNDAGFLNYRPSVIAACSIILAINIYERDLEKYQNKNFFAASKISADGLQELNTEIWNNQNVHSLTGYSIEDIKQCLYDISMFISTNLQPNRLKTFDVEGILNLKQYEGFNQQ